MCKKASCKKKTWVEYVDTIYLRAVEQFCVCFFLLFGSSSVVVVVVIWNAIPFSSVSIGPWRRMRSSRPLCVSIITFQHCPPNQQSPPLPNPWTFVQPVWLSYHTHTKKRKKEKKKSDSCCVLESYHLNFFFFKLNEFIVCLHRLALVWEQHCTVVCQNNMCMMISSIRRRRDDILIFPFKL